VTRQLLALIISTLTLVPSAVKAQEPAPKKAAQPKFNQVYVKIILPGDLATRDKDRPIIESWIAEQLKQPGQSKSTAATGWVLLDASPKSAIIVWDAKLDGKRWGCPVGGWIAERADGRIKVVLLGWDAGGSRVTISLKDEPGSREIAAVEETKREEGVPYVAVLIGPPPENPAAPTGKSK
jgi:hypothetical protein